jgi:penicillin-binding protein 1A
LIARFWLIFRRVAKTPKNKNKPGRTARLRSRWKTTLALFALLVVLIVCLVYGIWASSFDLKQVEELTERSAVYDMDGKLYSRLPGPNRVTVKLAQVSPWFLKALLAREDARFYSHHGIDAFGILRAISRNLTHGSAKEGASTLTQQLARNSFPDGLGSKKSLHRKLLEAFVALRIEQKYSKEQILEIYVNRIYFGANVYGIETASQAYFGKHAADLTLGEAATIAGIIRAPSYFSPFKNFKGAMHERDTVLDRMVKLGSIDEQQASKAKSASLAIAKKRPMSAQDNYAMDMVRREMDELLSDEQRQEGGMKIYVTIDPALQKVAEGAVDQELRKVEARPGYKHPKRADFSAEARAEEQDTPYLQGALVVIDNRSGGIRAVVGGRDFGESKYNRVTKATRQIGSTFKPFVYAAAFDKGLLPGTMIDDGPIARGEIRQAMNWSPENSDGTFKGPMHAEEGLIQSRNTMSVRVGQRAGLDAVARVALAVGIENMPHLPAVYLGAFEANVVDLTAAYSVFPNNGVRRQSYIIERIDDASGENIFRASHLQTKALDPGVAWMMTSTLSKVMERGTAAASKSLGFTKPAAGKTGTTNEFRDAWFVGYSTSLTCGVWVGLDKPETIVQKGYGSALALPIWVDVMRAASAQRYPANDFRPAVPVRRVVVCSASNELATSGCDRAGTAYTIDLPESRVPRDACSLHRGSILAQDQAPSSETPKPSGAQGLLHSFRKFFGGQ